MSQTLKIKNKVEELESIRGLAALVVVMYHIPSWHPFLHQIAFIRGGGLMVDLFFVLSGFVIYSAYYTKLHSATDFFKFQFLRWGRLYPVHIVFLIIYLVIETLKYVLQNYYGIQSHSKPPFVQNDFAAFLREIFLIKAFWPNETAMAFNSPAWSISAEFYTYIIFAVIVLYANRFKNVIFLVIALICIATLFTYQPEEYNFMLRCLSGFFIGCFTAYGVKLSCTHDGRPKFYINQWVIPLSILLIVWITSVSKGYFGIALFIYPASAVLIASILLSTSNFFKQILAHRFLVWLGTVSYSLYMSHGAVLWVYQQIIRVIFHRNEVMIRGISTPQFNATEVSMLILTLIIVCLIVAQVTYQIIEKPYRLKSRILVGDK